MTPRPDWHADAACLCEDPGLWDDDHRGAPVEEARVRALAVAICAECPVRQACLAAALEEESAGGGRYRHTIRGGLTGDQRAALARRRRRAEGRVA